MQPNSFIGLSPKDNKYRWYILALLTATATLVPSIPSACMPALFDEISVDLGLNLVQIGTIWGLSSIGGIFVSVASGFLTDRFGVTLTLSTFSILVGITGALRGISNSYLILAVTVLVHGTLRLMVPVIFTKSIGTWFKDNHLGLAMGILSMGMGLGLTLGPLLSATILSPTLGGWRNVMYFYGALSAGIGILWIFFGRESPQAEPTKAGSAVTLLRQAFAQMMRHKSIWLIGITMLFRFGAIIGLAGYLPLYLRGKGWDVASADGTLAAFFAISTVGVIPLSFLSDRISSRKAILFPAMIALIICLALLPVAEGGTVLALILLAGLFIDSFASICVTMLLETKGLAIAQSGIVVGIVFSMAQFGNAVLPPLGNSLADISPGAPFFFWAACSALALVTLTLIKDRGRR